jgi:predicted nucleic acid-binding protein
MVFSNTTPFISLSSISLLHLLPTIFGDVSVAPSVVDECNEGGRIVVPDLSVLPWVKVVAVQSQMQLPALFELDRR